jgi:hypothetical protein
MLLLLVVVSFSFSQVGINQPWNFKANVGLQGTVTIGKLVGGQDHFTSNKLYDTLLVPGTDSSDIVFVYPYVKTAPDTSSACRAYWKTDTIFIARHDTVLHALWYAWLRLKTK